MEAQPSRAEIWIIGTLAAMLAVGQTVFIAAVVFGIVGSLFGWRGHIPVNATALFLCFIIGIGVYFPLLVLIGSLGESAVNKAEGEAWGRRFLHIGPVALFMFWWRYVRPQTKTG
jgi:hypothetical protein